MIKYYLELGCNGLTEPYYAQGKWFDTKEEVVKQYKKLKRFVRDFFDYERFSDDFKCFIVEAIFYGKANYEIVKSSSIYTNEKGKVIY